MLSITTVCFLGSLTLLTLLEASRGLYKKLGITAGLPTEILDYPFMVAVINQNGGETITCGGSLISYELVLTAASCVQNYENLKLINVRAGSSVLEQGFQTGLVDGIYIHTDFKINKLVDLALVILKHPFQKSNKIQTIPIITAGESINDNSKTIALGWTRRDPKGNVTQLEKTVIPTLPNVLCKKYLKINDTLNIFCAGMYVDGNDLCKSDLGAPLIFKGKLIGVASFGSAFNNSTIIGTTGFVRLSKYTELINLFVQYIKR